MEAYEKSLHINDDVFEKMRSDADVVLQRLLKNMVEKDSMEGKVTITIDLSLIQEFIPNMDPSIEGETRRVLTPKISHKVGSVMQIKNETKGDKNCDGMELVFDSTKGEYVMKPIANTEQMTIFDAEYREVDEEVVYEVESEALEGRRVLALPGASDTEDEEIINTEEESEAEGYTEVNDVSEEDMSEVFSTEETIPFEPEEDYEYEEPESEEEE